jgi:hypothetical protein
MGASDSKLSWEDKYFDIFCGFIDSSARIEPQTVP